MIKILMLTNDGAFTMLKYRCLITSLTCRPTGSQDKVELERIISEKHCHLPALDVVTELLIAKPRGCRDVGNFQVIFVQRKIVKDFTFFPVLKSLLPSFSELPQDFKKNCQRKTFDFKMKRKCFDENETAEFGLLCQLDSVVRH